MTTVTPGVAGEGACMRSVSPSLRYGGLVSLALLASLPVPLRAQQDRESERFVEEQPGHRLAPEAWYRLGTCHLELGKKEPAVAAFEQALKVAEKGNAEKLRLRAECRYRLGQTLKELERPKDAAVQFKQLT